jgi:hypothetical protein
MLPREIINAWAGLESVVACSAGPLSGLLLRFPATLGDWHFAAHSDWHFAAHRLSSILNSEIDTWRSAR